MGKKRPMKRATNDDLATPSSSVKLCRFGIPEHSLCGKSPFGADLNINPLIRELIDERRVSAYWFSRIDKDTVMIDGCLVCHLANGFTAEDYARHESEVFGGMSKKEIQEVVHLLYPEFPFEWEE